MDLTRGAFVAGSLAAAVTVPAGARPAPVKLRMQTYTIDVGAAPYYAVETGIFKKYGIQAELMTLLNGPAVVTAVVSGSLDIGNCDTCTIAQAHAKGLGVTMIAPSGMYRSSAPTSALMVLKDSPIRSPRDLVGKTLGTPSLHDYSEATILAWGRKVGLRPQDLKIVEVNFPEMPVALASRRVDVVFAEEPLVSLLARDARVLARPSDAVGSGFVEGGFFCTPDFAKKHPDAVKRFADAIAETNRWADAHHGETLAILEKYSKGPVPKTMVRAFYPARIRAADVQPMIDCVAAAGFIPKRFSAAEIISPLVAS